MNSAVSEANQTEFKFPYNISFLDKDVNAQLNSHFNGKVRKYLQIGEEKWFIFSKFLDYSNDLYNFKVKHNDTWIITYPRSGTTMTQELIWLVANDLNYEAAAKSILTDRFPFFEVDVYNPEDTNGKKLPTLEKLETMETPRFIKTHLPFSLLTPRLLTLGCKIVYVARNPKDVAVSYYHFHQNPTVADFHGTFEEFWNYFQNGLVLCSPYWKHLKEAWKLRKNPNILFLFYEDIIKDLKSTIRKVSTFLNKSYSDEQINQLVDHLNFDNFKKNPAVNGEEMFGKNSTFIRKGKVGNWSEEFTPELAAIADKWIAENLADTDMKFPE